MSLVIHLPPKLEEELIAESTHLGVPLSDYVIRVLARGRNLSETPQTGADLMQYWQREGLVGTRPEIDDAPGHARALRGEATIRPLR